MGFIKGLFSTTKTLGKQIGGAIGNAADKTGTNAKISLQISSLEMERDKLNVEYENVCAIVGRKYVEYLLNDGTPAHVDVTEELRVIVPKLERIEEIEDEINRLEASRRDNQFTEEFNEAQQEYLALKKKLDQGLRLGVINKDEYNERLAKAKGKVDNFNEIQRVKSQYELGIITKEEMKAKLKFLGA